jgi:predicted DsbA family dithiol-disulfide isomerase
VNSFTRERVTGGMSDAVTVALWSDPYCPYAYLTTFRLRRLLTEPAYKDRVRVRPRALAVERDTKRPARKPVIEAEARHLMLLEPDIPYQPWSRPDWEWPVSSLPALEAVKCAEAQGLDAAWAMDWAVRTAFFAESACPTMRDTLVDCAKRSGIHVPRFEEDWDSGRFRRVVLHETDEGWYKRDFNVSPNLVLPDGRAIENPGGQLVTLDAEQNWKVTKFHPGDADPLSTLRALLDAALGKA